MNTSSVINPRTHWIHARFSTLTSWLPSYYTVISIVVLGLIANITVCFVLLRGGRFKKHLSNFMLFHLSITGIAYRLVVVPSQWAALFYPFRVKPTMLCKVAKTVRFTFNTAVFTSLVIIAFDRHQSITRPFQRLKHKPKFYRYLLAVWGYSMLCAVPQMYNAGSLVLNYTTSYNATSVTVAFYHCSVPSNKGFTSSTLAIIYYILGFLVPLVVIIIAYSNIYVFLRRKSRNRVINQAALKSTGKALRMLVLMVLGFVVCLGVPQLCDFSRSFVSRGKAEIVLLPFILELSSSIINPLIYGFYSADFNQGLKCRR